MKKKNPRIGDFSELLNSLFFRLKNNLVNYQLSDLILEKMNFEKKLRAIPDASFKNLVENYHDQNTRHTERIEGSKLSDREVGCYS